MPLWTKDTTSEAPKTVWTSVDIAGLTVRHDPSAPPERRIVADLTFRPGLLGNEDDWAAEESGGDIIYTPVSAANPGVTRIIFGSPGVAWLTLGVVPSTSHAIIRMSFVSNAASDVAGIDAAFGL